MFENIPTAPADPILGLADVYRADMRQKKINLGIGIFNDENGQTPVLRSVKKAEQLLLERETTKNYLSIDGLPDFAHHIQQLLFGHGHDIITTQRARTAQTPGGTGALRIAADFLVRQTPVKRIWISNPSWPNHLMIFTTAGLEVHQYDYYDAENHQLDFEAMLASLSQAKAGDAVLFHGCCHNPSGIDPRAEQWAQLACLSHQKGWLPLFDFAYQGFAQGLEEDAQGLRTFVASHSELLIASSCSKNFGLYNERVGAFTLIAAEKNIADSAFSQVKNTIRANYSNPPAHGAAVVATILGDQTLRTMWEQELTHMRQRIQQMRQLFVSTLSEKGANRDFSFIAKQNGMFSFCGLTQNQIIRMREEFAIYAVNSGRINVAGMTLGNMAPLCEAIVAVL